MIHCQRRYENSETGWDSKAKRDELFDPASRFLTIVKHRTTEHNTANAMPASMLMGFVMWRFDTEECMENDPCARVGEDEIAVAYW